MPEVRYDGPFEGVEVPALGAEVKKGDTLKVEDEELLKALLEQDCWSEAREKPAAPKARSEEV